MRHSLRFINPEILSSISGMELRARTVVEGYLSGLHHSPFKGFSVEFAEFRQYTPGDDPRHIDWKVFGRSDRYYVKEYEEETNLQCNILLDISGSMAGTSIENATSPKLSKFDYARYLVASLAYFIFQQRDGVGLVAFDREIKLQIPTKFRPGHLHNLLVEMENLKPGTGSEADLRFVHQVAESMRRKGMIIWVSDFFSDLDAVLNAFEHLRFRGHDVIVFQVVDEFELNFDFNRLTKFVGLEGEPAMLAMPQDMRAEYLKNFRSHLETLRKVCGINRIDYNLLKTTQPLDFALQAYLAARSGKL